MRILPIVERELRVASRRRGTYWVRFATAFVAMGTATLVLLGVVRENPPQQAQLLFLTLAGLAFAYSLFAGVLTTSDCISEEKREGTLGLLFLTSLRGYDVVIGKMAASSLRAVIGLVAMIPVMTLPLLMGAIAPESVACVALVLGNTMFLSLSFGVLVSVLARDPRQAIGGGLAAVLGLVLLVPLVRWICIEYILKDALRWYQPAPGVDEPLGWVLLSNPAMLLGWAVVGIFRGPVTAREFWPALGVQHALAWLALVAACRLAPRTWQDRASSTAAGTPRGPVPADALPGCGKRAVYLDSFPFHWIVARERRSVWHTWAGLGVVAGVWIWGYVETGEDWLQPALTWVSVFVAGLWLKVRLASVACRHLQEHRRSGALELLLCTAETPATVVAGNLSGLRGVILRPLAAVLAGGVFLLIVGDRSDSDLADLLIALAVTVGVLLLDLWTLAWTGMWLGMRSARYLRAWGMTVVLVMTLPWVIFVAGLVGLTVLVEVFDVMPGFDPGFRGSLFAWLLIAVAVDAVLLMVARSRLLVDFRELAVEPYGPLRGNPRTMPAGPGTVGVRILDAPPGNSGGS